MLERERAVNGIEWVAKPFEEWDNPFFNGFRIGDNVVPHSILTILETSASKVSFKECKNSLVPL